MTRYGATALPVPLMPAANQQWALFLDVDGTLLDFAPTPDAVTVPPMLISLLAELHGGLGGALALISGRSIDVLDRLFTPLRLPGAGLHGIERRDDSGTLQRTLPDAAAMARVRAAAGELAAIYPGLLLEDKRYSIALHYGKILQQKDALHALVQRIAQETGFELQPGRCVFELKPAGRNKADALTAFLAEAPFAGRLPVMLGDDLTDEHAFAVARQRGGMAIQVGDRAPGIAQFALSDPAAVLRWLQYWKERLQ